MKHTIELETKCTERGRCIKDNTKVLINGEYVADIVQTWHLLYAGEYKVKVTFPHDDTFYTEHQVDSFGEAVGLLVDAFKDRFV